MRGDPSRSGHSKIDSHNMLLCNYDIDLLILVWKVLRFWFWCVEVKTSDIKLKYRSSNADLYRNWPLLLSSNISILLWIATNSLHASRIFSALNFICVKPLDFGSFRNVWKRVSCAFTWPRQCSQFVVTSSHYDRPLPAVYRFYWYDIVDILDLNIFPNNV